MSPLLYLLVAETTVEVHIVVSRFRFVNGQDV